MSVIDIVVFVLAFMSLGLAICSRVRGRLTNLGLLACVASNAAQTAACIGVAHWLVG